MVTLSRPVASTVCRVVKGPRSASVSLSRYTITLLAWSRPGRRDSHTGARSAGETLCLRASYAAWRCRSVTITSPTSSLTADQTSLRYSGCKRHIRKVWRGEEDDVVVLLGFEASLKTLVEICGGAVGFYCGTVGGKC